MLREDHAWVIAPKIDLLTLVYYVFPSPNTYFFINVLREKLVFFCLQLALQTSNQSYVILALIFRHLILIIVSRNWNYSNIFIRYFNVHKFEIWLRINQIEHVTHTYACVFSQFLGTKASNKLVSIPLL